MYNHSKMNLTRGRWGTEARIRLRGNDFTLPFPHPRSCCWGLSTLTRQVYVTLVEVCKVSSFSDTHTHAQTLPSERRKEGMWRWEEVKRISHSSKDVWWVMGEGGPDWQGPTDLSWSRGDETLYTSALPADGWLTAPLEPSHPHRRCGQTYLNLLLAPEDTHDLESFSILLDLFHVSIWIRTHLERVIFASLTVLPLQRGQSTTKVILNQEVTILCKWKEVDACTQ